MMKFKRLTAGWWFFAVFALLACGVLPALIGPGYAADAFPYDQELLLDARPIRPAKRMPVLTVQSDGRATVDLWCRTVPALVLIEGQSIKIKTAPLPESLPQYMSAGQCNGQRIAADLDMLAALTQVTEWRKRGDVVELKSADGAGAKLLRFRRSSH